MASSRFPIKKPEGWSLESFLKKAEFTADKIGTKHGNVRISKARSSQSADGSELASILFEEIKRVLCEKDSYLTLQQGYLPETFALKNPKITRYEVDDMMTWHVDSQCEPGHIGTIIVILNPTEFTGGNLEFKNEFPEIHVLSEIEFEAVFFTLDGSHRVLPVTTGTRFVFRSTVCIQREWVTKPLNMSPPVPVGTFLTKLEIRKQELLEEIAQVEATATAYSNNQLPKDFAEKLLEYPEEMGPHAIRTYDMFEKYSSLISPDDLKGVDRIVYEYLRSNGYKILFLKKTYELLIDEPFKENYVEITDDSNPLILLTIIGTNTLPEEFNIEEEYNDNTYDSVARGAFGRCDIKRSNQIISVISIEIIA